MSVKTFDFLKIQNSKLLVCEIRPVRCSVNTNAGRLKTTKWMNFQHWKELRVLLKTIAEDYESARIGLKVTEDIKYGKPQTKISDSIKIAYMWALNKECCRHFLTPRQDTCWSDTEDDPINLNDKGGRYKSLQPCGDMVVVSVALLDETEIQRHQKSSKNVHDTQSHRATSECISSSQYLDRSLFMALDPTLVPKTASISEYFTTQTSDTKSSSNSDLDESRKIKPKILNLKCRTSKNTKKSPIQQHDLFTEDIQTMGKKRQTSFFDTESSESTELQLKSSSTSSGSQAEAAASKILMKASAVANLITNKDLKKETISEIKGITLKKEKISNRVDLPLKSSTNDYALIKGRCSFSVPLVEMGQQNLKGSILDNIKVENSDSPDDTIENSINKDVTFSFSSKVTPSISSPVDENCTETPEPYLKVGRSPTSTKITIDNSLDLHPELNTYNNLEVYSLDSEKYTIENFTRKMREQSYKIHFDSQTESISGIENSNVISPGSHDSNKIRSDYRNTSCLPINNCLRTQSEILQNESKSDLIGKFIKNQDFCTESVKNKEQEIQRYKSLKSCRETSKRKKERIPKKFCDNKPQKGTKNVNQEIQNKIPNKDLDQNYTVVEYDEQIEKKCIKARSSHSLKHHENPKTKHIRNLDYCKSQFCKDKEKSEIENESNTGNEFSYLIPHTTEEITDNELLNFQIEESVLTSKNVIETNEVPVSVMTASESVSRMSKRLEEPGDMYSSSVYACDVNKDKCSSPRKPSEKKMQIDNEIVSKLSTKSYCKIRTRSSSVDMLKMATASPDMFDNSNTSEDKNIAVSNNSNSKDEINELSKTVEEEICKDLIPQKKDTSNIASQYSPTTHDCLASESRSVLETDNVDDIRNYLSKTPERLSFITGTLPNLECSPILGSRALKIKTKNQLNSSLQHEPKRMKIKRRNCNIKNGDTKKEDTIASLKYLRKDFKGIDQIQESEKDKKDNLNIEDDIFEFSYSSKNCIRNRKTLDDREEVKKSNDEEIIEINSLEIGVSNHLHMTILQDNSTDDGDSNIEDIDLPDLGSAHDYEVGNTAERLDDVSGVTIKHVLIKDNVNTNIKIKSVTDILNSPTKICKRSEYFKVDKYIPAKDGKGSISKSSLYANEVKNSNKMEECVSNDEETNNSSLACTLEENSISSCCTDSAESPDTRRSQRIKSIKKHDKKKSCCLGCENIDENFHCKDRKSSKIKTKSKTNISEQNIEYPYIKSYNHKNLVNKDVDLIITTNNITQRNIKSPSKIGAIEKNKKNIKKRDEILNWTDKFTLDHSSETTSEEIFKESFENNNENNNISSILADELFKMSYEQKNTSLILGSTETENNVLDKYDDTQALLDSVLLDGLESNISKVQPMAKTKKAMAEFDKMYKNFKSRRKKTDTDIALFLDSGIVTKKPKQIKSIRKKSIVNRKFKMSNLPDNQTKLNTWITKSNKSNPSLHVEEPKASGSKDFENVIAENDIIYKQPLSKGKQKGEKRKKGTNNSRFVKKNRSSELSSQQTFKVHAPDEGKEVQENKSKGNKDHSENGFLRKKTVELDENSVPQVDEITSTSGTSEQSEQLDSSVLITHEEKCLTQAEQASIIARGLEVMKIEKLNSLLMNHLPYLKNVAKGAEINERHSIYMEGGAAARCNTPEVIFAPFTDEQLEHVHSVLRSHLLKKLQNNKIEGREYLWMVLVPTFLIRLVMEQEKVSYNDAELLFKHMAFPKRPNRDSLGLGERW